MFADVLQSILVSVTAITSGILLKQYKRLCKSSKLKSLTLPETSTNLNSLSSEEAIINPLSPNIHAQILQTDLYTFP